MRPLIALLIAHVVIAQQPSPSPSVTGHFDAAFRQYGFSAVASSSRPELPPVVREIAARFAREEKLAAVTAARALLAASPTELAQGIAMIRDRFYQLPDDGTALRPAVLALMAEFKAHIATLPRNDGAAPARELLWMEYSIDRGNEGAHQQRLASFLKTYEGTPAYIHHMIGQVESEYSYEASKMRARSRELAKQYDGTEYGAHALYSLAFRLAHDAVTRPPQPDPTERFFEVLSIVEELQSGRFPKCEWVDKAPALIDDFQVFQPQFAPGNIARMANAYTRFILAQLAAGVEVPNIGFLMSYRIGRLKNAGDNSLPLIESVIADLAASPGGPDYARSVRAAFYLGVLNDNSMNEFPITPARAAAAARESLEPLVKSASPQMRAAALADLASMDFHLGRYREARAGYLEFVRTWPTSDWAWVAALRAAEALEALGDVKGAAVEYEAAAARFKEPSSGAALALVAAGDTRDAGGDVIAAAANYQAALALWGGTVGRIMIYTNQADGARPVPKPERFNNLTKEVLEARLEKLASAVTPEGALLYQARRALDDEKPRDAQKLLERFQKEFPRSTNLTEVAALLRRAKFESALADGATNAGRSAVDRELDSLAVGKFDSIAAAARLAQAAMKVRQGRSRDAETLTRATLERWHAAQPAVATPQSAVDRDVAAIRAALFLPRGGGVFGKRGWNAFDWPDKTAPFIVVGREVAVKTADGRESSRPVTFAAPAGDRVLFLAPEDFRALNLILDRIGGTETAEWVNATDLPNQPIGGAPEIAAMWAKFFHVRPGHWGGWELTTYPDISRITFDRQGHALAEFTIGYSGGTVELEKENGRWVAKRIVSEWIT